MSKPSTPSPDASKTRSNTFWLRKLWRWLKVNWNDIEWPLIIVLGLTSLISGIVGFQQYYASCEEHYSFWDYLYRSWQLFTLESGFFDTGKRIPITLQMARWASPLIAAYTLLQALQEVFKEQLKLLRLRRMRNHAVVCGLGRKGLLLIKELRGADRQVVVIERESNNPLLTACHSLGVIVITGDGRDELILRKAGVERARYLISVCNEDGTNAEVAEQARNLVKNRKGSALTCIIHVTDTYLWTLLREREFYKEQAETFCLELFNIFDSGARVLLRETLWEAPPVPSPHLLVIGMGDLAENLIVHAAQAWCLQRLPEPLRITIIDTEASRKLDALVFRYPLIKQACHIQTHTVPIDHTELQKIEFLQNAPSQTSITHAYVCLDDSALGLQAGFTLLQLLQHKKTQIMVRMNEDTGLAKFLSGAMGAGKAYTNLMAFGLLDRTCRMELLDDGTHEGLARVIHQDYVDREKRKGHTPATNPSIVSWEDLPEELRQSNLRQADNIGIKLNAIQCGIIPWREYGAENFEFSEQEIDFMARMEHERWWQERIERGWQYAPVRDDSRKHHPDMLPWDDPRFTEEAKEKDRQAVRLIPNLLARAGFQIYRFE